MLNRIRLWLRSVVLRRRLEREMQEEMAEHLERSTTRLMGRGLPAEEARRQAVREFGNVTYLQEEARYARGTGWLDALVADLRYALRQFARKPGTTAVMLVVLAGGMAITTLLFSYVHSYAVQPPLAVPADPDLVRIRGSQSAGAYGRAGRPFTEEEFLEYRRLTGVFESVAGWTEALVGVDAGEDPERRGLEAKATFVTPNYFQVLGVRPAIGAGFTALDGEGAAVAVLGHRAWDQLFGRSPDVIGSTVSVHGLIVTIVGVAPERFIGMHGPADFQLWLPLEARRLLLPGDPADFRAAARLRDGVSLDEATAAAQVVAARSVDPQSEREVREPSTQVVPLLAANGDAMFERDVRLLALSFGLLALLVLLVTCTNVSALLTGLAMARRQEIAVRLSLGAGRRRLIRQLLTESALLATIAGGVALGIVWLVLGAVARRLTELPLAMTVTWPATIFTFGVALAVGAGFGLSPALHATRVTVASALKDATATIAGARGRLQRGLVVAQIAFTQPLVVLLAATLVLVVTAYRPGSLSDAPDRVVIVGIRPATPFGPSAPSDASAHEVRATAERLQQRLSALPGVETAVVDWSSYVPLGPYLAEADDAAGAPRATRLTGESAAGEYFGIMGIPLVRGRTFTEADAGARGTGADVPVIIGADLARELWAGDPVGRRLTSASDTADGPATLVVVGVIEDPSARDREAGEDFRVYLPPDTTRTAMGVLLRTAVDAQPLVPAIRAAAQEEAPGMALRIRTFAEILDVRTRHFRTITSGVTAAGVIALLLSALGLYAVVAFAVGQRTREIAVRMAMGAAAAQVVRRFVADGLRLSAYGLAIGLPLSLVGLRALLTVEDDLPNIALPHVTVIVAGGVLLVALMAVWIPARRAAGVEPAAVLRSE